MIQEKATLDRALELSDTYIIRTTPYKILLFKNGEKWSWAITDEDHHLRSSSYRMVRDGFVSFDVAVRTAETALLQVKQDEELERSRMLVDPLDDSSLLKRVMTRDQRSLYEIMLAAQVAIRKSSVRSEIAS